MYIFQALYCVEVLLFREMVPEISRPFLLNENRTVVRVMLIKLENKNFRFYLQIMTRKFNTLVRASVL